LNPIYFRPFVRAIVANDLLIMLRPTCGAGAEFRRNRRFASAGAVPAYHAGLLRGIIDRPFARQKPIFRLSPCLSQIEQQSEPKAFAHDVRSTGANQTRRFGADPANQGAACAPKDCGR
jgi:hypothetical protein